MSGIKNHPTSIRAAGQALFDQVAVTLAAGIEPGEAFREAFDQMREALAQPEVSRADLIERAEWAVEGIAKMRAGEPVLPIHIQAIVNAAEAGLQASRSFGVRWAADMRAIERWRAGKPSREISELLAAAAPVVGSIKRAAMLGPIPEDAKRLEAALEDALSYSIEAAVPERRTVMLPDHADLVVWLLELLERPSSPTLDQADQMATRIGRAGLWHASQGSAHGDSLDGGEVAALIRSLARLAIAADRRAFLAEQQAIPADLESMIAEHLTGELGDSYDCQRVWSAWDAGTMDEGDFSPVRDRMDDLAAGLAGRIAAFSILPLEPAEGSGSGQEPDEEPADPAATVRTIEAAADAGLIPNIAHAAELRAQAEAKGRGA